MEGCEWLDTASLGICICGDPALEQFPGYWVQDCSACAQNIQLAAHAHGLGACWLALERIEPREKAIRETLGIPDQIVPFALLSIGYPAYMRVNGRTTDPQICCRT
jgi:nitroreductase